MRIKRLAPLILAAVCSVPVVARAAKDPWAEAKESLVTMSWNTAAADYAALRAGSETGSPKWVEATFCEAVARQHAQPASAGSIEAARKLFQDVIDTSKDDRFVARSILNLGRIAELVDYPEDRPDFDTALEQYQRVMQRWPDAPIGSEAALRAGAVQVMAFDAPDFVRVKAGIALLEQWLAKHPANPYAGIMWQYMGDSYFRPLSNYAKALTCYDKVDQIGWPDAGNQAAWYWRAGQIAERYVHDTPRAIHYYTALIEKTPSSGQAYAALQAIKRLGGRPPAASFLQPSAATTEPSGAAQ